MGFNEWVAPQPESNAGDIVIQIRQAEEQLMGLKSETNQLEVEIRELKRIRLNADIL